MKSKIAVVTGAANDISKQIALALANSGAAIAIVDLNEDGAKAVVKEIAGAGGKTIRLRMDVTDEQAIDSGIDRVAEELGPVNILVSNAGIQIVNPLVSCSFIDWKEIQTIHVDGAFPATCATLHHMYRDDRGGVVIYMGSVHSHEGSPLESAYMAARHAPLGLSKVLTEKDAAYNVRSHVVCPGSIRALLVEKRIPEQAKEFDISEEDTVKKVMLGDIVDGVFAMVKDVAETIRFPTTFPSAVLISQSFVVNHGWFIQ